SGRGFCGGAPLFVEGDPAVPPGTRPIVAIRPVAGAYFETMRMPIRRGRSITRRDVEDKQLVAVVNDAFVRAGLQNRDPIGMRVRLGPHALPGVDAWFTIVGVVATTPTVALGESTSAPKMYIPMVAGPELWPAVNVMTYVVRTSTPPTDLTQPIRAAIADVDPNLAMSQVRTLQSFVDTAGSQRAFTLVLLLVASGTALLLGLVGIYSVMSYLVSQRTAEIGVRLALGAEPGRVMRMVVGQGATVTAGGIAAGLLAAFASSPVISPLLYRVNPHDPAVFATVALTLMTVAVVACWFPARRAASVDPLVALRSD
ncbi:MAG TPA: FtsX-like permease family protein, partial [Vicinamibacterales bacterium]